MSAATLEAEPVTEDRTDTLVVADRCDSCGAQAFAGAIFEHGYLMFCGHHFSKYEAKIRETATQIFDERWKLDGKRLDVSP